LAGGQIGVLYSSGATSSDGALLVTAAGATPTATKPTKHGLRAVKGGAAASAPDADAAISGVIERLRAELRDAA
jgi:hypothetical protein